MSIKQCFVKPGCFLGRQSIHIGNEFVVLTVLPGGGHIAALQTRAAFDQVSAVMYKNEEGGEHGFFSPLWIPPWPSCDPACSSLADPSVFGDGLEGKYLLSHIAGHNLCLDVFGAHSEAESKHAGQGMSFHGEAGQVTWRVTASDVQPEQGTVTLSAHLPGTCLNVDRTFTVRSGSPTIKVDESMHNLVGFQRALGRAQHVSFGEAFLRAKTTVFNTNAELGRTMPGEAHAPDSSFSSGADFSYPDVPTPSGGTADWRRFPRTELQPSQGLCTLRVDPASEWGWLTALRPGGAGGSLSPDGDSGMAVVYAWKREAFPWVMSWEENMARADLPWSRRTLVRGLEFSSYAFPLGRQANVEIAKLFDTATFEWLDAHERKQTQFYISLQTVDAAAKEPIAMAVGEAGGCPALVSTNTAGMGPLTLF